MHDITRTQFLIWNDPINFNEVKTCQIIYVMSMHVHLVQFIATYSYFIQENSKTNRVHTYDRLFFSYISIGWNKYIVDFGAFDILHVEQIQSVNFSSTTWMHVWLWMSYTPCMYPWKMSRSVPNPYMWYQRWMYG